MNTWGLFKRENSNWTNSIFNAAFGTLTLNWKQLRTTVTSDWKQLRTSIYVFELNFTKSIETNKFWALSLVNLMGMRVEPWGGWRGEGDKSGALSTGCCHGHTFQLKSLSWLSLIQTWCFVLNMNWNHKNMSSFCDICRYALRWRSVHVIWAHFDGLVQERHNSSALAMELCLSCTNPLILWVDICGCFLLKIPTRLSNAGSF